MKILCLTLTRLISNNYLLPLAMFVFISLISMYGCASKKNHIITPTSNNTVEKKLEVEKKTITEEQLENVKFIFKNALEAMESSNLDLASNYFQTLSQNHPQFSGVHVNLGIIHLKKEQLDKAEIHFRKALAIKNSRNIPETYNLLGVTLRRKNKYDEALSMYKSAIQLYPGYAKANLNLAILYDRYLKQPAESLKYYQKYSKLVDNVDRRVQMWINDAQLREQQLSTKFVKP